MGSKSVVVGRRGKLEDEVFVPPAKSSVDPGGEEAKEQGDDEIIDMLDVTEETVEVPLHLEDSLLTQSSSGRTRAISPRLGATRKPGPSGGGSGAGAGDMTEELDGFLGALGIADQLGSPRGGFASVDQVGSPRGHGFISPTIGSPRGAGFSSPTIGSPRGAGFLSPRAGRSKPVVEEPLKRSSESARRPIIVGRNRSDSKGAAGDNSPGVRNRSESRDQTAVFSVATKDEDEHVVKGVANRARSGSSDISSSKVLTSPTTAVKKSTLPDPSRPPTEAELEKCLDYTKIAALPPLPDSAPIANKLAYKGYMRLKYAWSERQAEQRAKERELAQQSQPKSCPGCGAPLYGECLICFNDTSRPKGQGAARVADNPTLRATTVKERARISQRCDLLVDEIFDSMEIEERSVALNKLTSMFDRGSDNYGSGNGDENEDEEENEEDSYGGGGGGRRRPHRGDDDISSMVHKPLPTRTTVAAAPLRRRGETQKMLDELDEGLEDLDDLVGDIVDAHDGATNDVDNDTYDMFDD